MGSTTIQQAPQRNYAQEAQDTLATQIQLAPQLYASEAQYQPLYTQLALQNAQTSLLGGNGQMGLIDLYNKINPQLSQISAASNTAQRTADIQDVANLGPQMRAALQASNPELFANLAKAEAAGGNSTSSGQTSLQNQLARNPYALSNLQAQQVGAGNVTAPGAVNYSQVSAPGALNYSQVAPSTVSAAAMQQVNAPGALQADQVNNERIAAGQIQGGRLQDALTQQALNAGPSAISQALQQQALNAIQQGGQLSEQEMRDATQATRAAYAARGMGLGDQSALGEVQNRLINQRQRQLENLGLAQNINSQLLGEQAANRGFSQGVLGQNVAIQGQNIGNALAAAQANQNTSLQSQLANQAANLQAGQFSRNQSLQAAMANQNAVNNATLAAQQINADQSMRAALANQGAQLTAGQFQNQQALQAALANQQAGINVGQFANQQDLQAQQMNQAAGLQAMLANQQANLQAGQFNNTFNQQAQAQYLQNLGQLAQLQNQTTSADRSYLAQLVGLRQATVGDPFSAILGRSSAAFNQAQGLQGQGVGLQQIAGPALFNPESSYANNIYGGNQQATNAANIAQAQTNAALFGGAMSGLGSLMGGQGGAALIGKLCWVAREVYGEDDPRWRKFRTWMLCHAPAWFQKLYIKFGPRFAEWIHDKPRIKSVIRRWMDARIATLANA